MSNALSMDATSTQRPKRAEKYRFGGL
jgi:hypothetical protein